MKITLQNTTRIVSLNGVPARIWEGETAAGIKCIAFITRIAVAEGADQTQFNRELAEQSAPSSEAESFPLRMVL